MLAFKESNLRNFHICRNWQIWEGSHYFLYLLLYDNYFLYYLYAGKTVVELFLPFLVKSNYSKQKPYILLI